jgi:hypothetical protein
VWSLTRSADELSIVTDVERVPDDVPADGPWRALRVEGPLDLGTTGVLASLLEPLADAGISVFTLSTYDTDLILVPHDRLEAAVSAVVGAGHRITSRGGT